MFPLHQKSVPIQDFFAEEGKSTSIINPFSAGINFRRQNLTSVDVRFWRLKSIPAPKEYTYL